METDQIELLSFVPRRHKRKDGSVYYTLRDSSGTWQFDIKKSYVRSVVQKRCGRGIHKAV